MRNGARAVRFDGLARGRLMSRRLSRVGRPHPPLPACRCLDWETISAFGDATNAADARQQSRAGEKGMAVELVRGTYPWRR